MSGAARAILVLLMFSVVLTAYLLEEEARRRRVYEPRLQVPDLVLVDWVQEHPDEGLQGPAAAVLPSAGATAGPQASIFAPSSSQPPAGEDPSPAREYRVVEGDSFYRIADRVYGAGAQWPRIWEANKDRVATPESLRPGDVLKIPPAR